MEKEIIFEELEERERILLLKAFDYDVNDSGFVLTPSGKQIPSKEFPGKFIHIKDATLVPGSLEVIDSTPTAISRFIREKVEKSNDLIGWRNYT